MTVNVTIDDELGDSVTGARPVYEPPDRWTQGAGCSDCLAKPDAGRAFDGTWHDSSIFSLDTISPEVNITMTFSGNTVEAYCILANSASSNFSTFTNLTFSIDGAQVGRYVHASDGSETYIYDALVYANSSVGGTSSEGNPAGQEHTFVIHMPMGENPSLILFDYARYIVDSSTLPNATSPPASTVSSTHSHASSSRGGAIAGGVVACFLAILAILITTLLWRRRKRGRNETNHVTPLHLPPSPGGEELRRASGQGKGLMTENGVFSNHLDLRPSASPSNARMTTTAEGVSGENNNDILVRELEQRRRRLAQLQSEANPPHSEGTQDQIEEMRREIDSLKQMVVAIAMHDHDRSISPPSYH